LQNFSLLATQVTVEQTHEEQVTVVVVEEEQQQQQQQTEMATQQQQQQPQPEQLLSKDEIEEYEESRYKFRELWEAKREKVCIVKELLCFSFS